MRQRSRTWNCLHRNRTIIVLVCTAPSWPVMRARTALPLFPECAGRQLRAFQSSRTLIFSGVPAERKWNAESVRRLRDWNRLEDPIMGKRSKNGCISGCLSSDWHPDLLVALIFHHDPNICKKQARLKKESRSAFRTARHLQQKCGTWPSIRSHVPHFLFYFNVTSGISS